MSRANTAARVVRYWCMVAGCGVATKARWKVMAAPPPVRSDEDFERRLTALENARPRLFAWSALTFALAVTCLTVSLPNPLL